MRGIQIVEQGKVDGGINIDYAPILNKILKYGQNYVEHLTQEEMEIIHNPNCVQYFDRIARGETN